MELSDAQVINGEKPVDAGAGFFLDFPYILKLKTTRRQRVATLEDEGLINELTRFIHGSQVVAYRRSIYSVGYSIHIVKD